MGKRKLGALDRLEVDLTSLQNKLRQDPRSYQADFRAQYNQYEQIRSTFAAQPSSVTEVIAQSFHDLVDFIAHVADCYPSDTKAFPDDLRSILTQHHAVLSPDVREKVVGSLCLLRKKDLISSEYLLTTFFPILVSTPSKSLRAALYQKIVSDLRNANAKATNHPLNRTIQNVLTTLVTSDRTSSKGIWAVRLTRELWRRQIWTDAKSVEVMKEAALSENEKVVIGGVRFFLGGDKEREEAAEEVSSDEETMDLRKLSHQQKINKKSRKQAKVYKAAVEKVKKQERKKKQPDRLNFSALHLLNNPQGFVEQLFEKHLLNTRSRLSLENKLLVLQLVTRLVGLHELVLIQLYPWFTKYLTPKQASVTTFLACLAQATHRLVPPDAIEPLVLKIANEFVSEAAASEVAAAGLNAIREICLRQNLAMTETLLQDLVQYKKSKDKGVMMAAKGLLSLYREVGPDMLKRRDRGKTAAIGLCAGDIQQTRFGEQNAGEIEGLELLAKWKEEQRQKKALENGGQVDDEDAAGGEDDGFNSSDWDVQSDDSDDSGGWIAVSSESEDEPSSKRARKATSEAPASEPPEVEEDPAVTAARIQKLGTTTLLTPADLAKMQELLRDSRISTAMAGSHTASKGKIAAARQEALNRHIDEGLTAEQIEMPATLRKTTREERIALAREGKPDRAEHKSTQAIRKSKKEAEGKSTTNKEKARRKNLIMTLGKAKQKQKRSLVQTRKVLKMHIERSKRGGKRGNQ